MKLKGEFELHRIAEQYVAVPASKSNQAPPCTINLNETGAAILEALSEDRSEDDLVEMLSGRYDVDEEIARGDVADFIALLGDFDLLD